jgi:chromosome partitioning protein
MILTVTNQKGGVGKTTTAVNLAACLAELGQRILLVDMDPQGNATMGSGVEKDEVERSGCDVLLGDATAREVIVAAGDNGFDLLPGNRDLVAAEVKLLTEFGRESKLKKALETVAADYDLILVDCPPSLNMLTVNALTAADGVLVPMQCEYYALEGLSALTDTINQIREAVNPSLRVAGILRCMYDPRNNLANEVSAQLIQHFGDAVYRTVIPRNVRLAEAPSFGVAAIKHDRHSRGASAYEALATEVLRRTGKHIRAVI